MKKRFSFRLWFIVMFCIAACAKTIASLTPSNDPKRVENIKIMGTPEFTAQTRAALILLEQKDPSAFNKIQSYIGIIEQGEHSGMWAWEEPHRCEVGDTTAFSPALAGGARVSVTWYASTIAHDLG